MYKEKIQKIITENFINDKIDIERFIRLSEKAEKISEEKAKKIVNEQIEAIGALTIWAAMMAGYIIFLKKLSDNVHTGKAYCTKIKGGIADPEKRKKAIATCRVDFIKKCINELKSTKPKCQTAKNTEGCLRQVSRGIKFYEKHLLQVQHQLRK